MRTAVVLAGGLATRFGGRDKAVAKLDGKPLIRHVVEGVAPAVDEVVVNCREAQRDRLATALAGLDYRVAVDPVPDRGPVAGMHAGCRATRADWAFVTACDAPFVRPELVSALFETVESDGLASETAAVVPRTGDRRHPLAALYRTENVVRAGGSLLEDGNPSVRGLLEAVPVASVPCPVPERALRDVDTPAVLSRIEASTG